jgi:hypothetical protein
VAGDKGFDSAEFVKGVRDLGLTPDIAQNITAFRGSNIPYRIAETPGYELSQRFRKRIEEIFGWFKTVGGMRKLRYVGVPRNRFWIEMTSSAYNLVRMGNLAAVPASGWRDETSRRRIRSSARCKSPRNHLSRRDDTWPRRRLLRGRLRHAS